MRLYTLGLLGLPTVETLRSRILQTVGALNVDLTGVSRVGASEGAGSDPLDAAAPSASGKMSPTSR
jgi:hypothetical protein